MNEIKYYVCGECSYYHVGKRVKPKKCERCASNDLEEIHIHDKDFNYMMKIVAGLKTRRNNQQQN